MLEAARNSCEVYGLDPLRRVCTGVQVLAKIHGSRLAAKAPATRTGGSKTPLTSVPWASPMATSDVGETIRNRKQLRLTDLKQLRLTNPHETVLNTQKHEGSVLGLCCVRKLSSRRFIQKTRKKGWAGGRLIYTRGC